MTMDEDDYHHTEKGESSKDLSINVITLNCWGLLFFSKHRQQRIQSIADYLSEQKYDVVFLQELWVRSDFELIRQQTSSIYKFAHLFPTKSILGTSGLAILSKWSPTHISFMPFTVNGSPLRPWHGDWFTGKGTAYVRVDLKDLRMHLFCTHMHAQYSENETLDDQYSIHRICQSYQLSKLINMTKDLVAEVGKASELFILAGDLNTSPEEFPFQLLESCTGLQNIFHSVSKSENSAVKHRTDLVTCGHSENSYTGLFTKEQSKDDKNRHKQQTNKGKQIDYVLYKLINRRTCDKNMESSEMTSSSDNNFMSCVSERIQCLTKDPKTGLSFSDHQPVAVRFRIRKQCGNHKVLENGDLGYYSSTTMSARKNSFEAVDSDGFKGYSSDSDCKFSRVETTSLQKACKLMRSYINENESSKQKLTCSLGFFGIVVILVLIMANIYHDFMDSLLLILSCTLLTVILVFVLIVIEIVYRFEQHGIRCIIEEMSCSTSIYSINETQ